MQEEQEIKLAQEKVKSLLQQQQERVEQLKKRITELEQVSNKLQDLPKQTTHKCMVPLGDLAFMPGELIHTNEILVLLGENYFVEKSAHQAQELATRRIEYLKQNLTTESAIQKQLLSKMGLTSQVMSQFKEYEDDEVMEIKEEYTEEQEAIDAKKSFASASKPQASVGKQAELDLETIFDVLQYEEDQDQAELEAAPFASEQGENEDEMQDEFEKYFNKQPQVQPKQQQQAPAAKKQVTFGGEDKILIDTKQPPNPHAQKTMPQKPVATTQQQESSGFNGIVKEKITQQQLPASNDLDDGAPKKVSKFKQNRMNNK